MSVFHLLILFIQLLHCAQAVLKKKKKQRQRKVIKERKALCRVLFCSSWGSILSRRFTTLEAPDILNKIKIHMNCSTLS